METVTVRPEQSSPSMALSISHEHQVLRLSFETHHGWLRHYDALLISITTFVSGIVLGFFALSIQEYNRLQGEAFVISIQSIMESGVLSILLLFSVMASLIMLAEVKWAWGNLIRIEKALGFYRSFESLDRGTIFPATMQETSNKIPTFFKLSFMIQAVLFILVWIHPFI